MIERQAHTGFMKVEDYGLAEWLAQCQEVIKQGYRFDFESNANYPIAYGTQYIAVLVPDSSVVKASTSESVSIDATVVAKDATEDTFADSNTPKTRKKKLQDSPTNVD